MSIVICVAARDGCQRQVRCWHRRTGRWLCALAAAQSLWYAIATAPVVPSLVFAARQ